MPTYTLADASQPSIVRKALDDALVSGRPQPLLHFGPILVRLQGDGRWSVRNGAPSHNLTTEQAITAIISAVRNER